MLLTVIYMLQLQDGKLKVDLTECHYKYSNYRSMQIQKAQANHIENYVCTHTHLHTAICIYTHLYKYTYIFQHTFLNMKS